VELEPLRELGDAELARVRIGELLEHVERVRHGLDDVVGLFPAALRSSENAF
jgi:hypothetical protein